MRLNEKCMRDILQYFVKNIHITYRGYVYTSCSVLDVAKNFPQYDEKEVLYSIVKLIELKYITINSTDVLWNENTKVCDVTYYGHKYLYDFQQ